MILPSGHSTRFLADLRDGKIEMGIGIGSSLDEYLRFKKSQLNFILGHDNVGKTYWFLWYMLSLSTQHDLEWVIWTGENKPGTVMRDLIRMYTGKPFEDLTHKQIRLAEMKMEYYFKIVDNSKMYKPKDILDIFASVDVAGCFIDPFTGLDRGMMHADNYEFLNNTRLFCNQTGKTIYVSTHPNSESGRANMLYPTGHNWAGHLKPPLKGHIEGGKPFLNRCDDMIIVHRLVKHPEWRFRTLVDVEKVKDTDTGGRQTDIDSPIAFEYNYGLGFTLGGIDTIKRNENTKERQNRLFDLQKREEKERTVMHSAITNAILEPSKSDFDQPVKYVKPDDSPF